MQSGEIDRLVHAALEKNAGRCCPGGTCSDGLCVIHNKEGVRNLVSCGAARVTAGMGVGAAGGIEADLAGLIDHTLLKPEATKDEVTKLCAEAKKFSFASVCINPSYVPLSAKLLKNGTLKTYQGFPHGMPTTEAETINRDLLAFLKAPVGARAEEAVTV